MCSSLRVHQVFFSLSHIDFYNMFFFALQYFFALIENGCLPAQSKPQYFINTIVAGAFLAISVPDLVRYVKHLPKSAAVPNTRGSYTSWKKQILFNRSHSVLVIYKYVCISFAED